MRNSTRNAVTVVGLGVLGVSYSIGAAAQTGSTFNSTTIGINGTDATAAAQAAAAGTQNSSTATGTTDSSGTTAAAGTGSATSSSGSGSSSKSNSTSSSSSSKSSVSSSNSSSNSSNSSSGNTTAPVATTAPAPVSTPTPTKTTAASSPVTKTGGAINYRFGVIQVSITKDNGKITAVNLVQGTATHGRESAFPYLQQYAVAAQGSGFANMSGATYTTDAFKQAVDSALSKF